jgi:ssRNA-specific RNase YbeY (16S rRNA maturation enzyme)
MWFESSVGYQARQYQQVTDNPLEGVIAHGLLQLLGHQHRINGGD